MFQIDLKMTSRSFRAVTLTAAILWGALPSCLFAVEWVKSLVILSRFKSFVRCRFRRFFRGSQISKNFVVVIFSKHLFQKFNTFNAVKSQFNESQCKVKSQFKVWNLVTKMKFHIKKSRFSIKSQFKQSKCADKGHSLNRDFTVLNSFNIFKVQWTPLIVATSGLALTDHNSRWLFYPPVLLY